MKFKNYLQEEFQDFHSLSVLDNLDDGSHLIQSSNCPKCGTAAYTVITLPGGDVRKQCQSCSNLYIPI